MASLNLDNCESEPIHIPGAVQPHGVLLVCGDKDLAISNVSANVTEYLGKTPAAVLGASVTSLFDAFGAAQLVSAAKQRELRTINPLRLATTDLRYFEAVLHRPLNDPGLLVIELERTKGGPEVFGGPSFDPRLRSAIVRLQVAHDLRTLTRVAAEEVRSLTGFDRAMVYEFDADWNGAVVAESKREDLDSFLGQHYPASDIPAQARRLYELNWLRLIVDVGYQPVPLLASAESTPLDMSFAVLRSVSPIHLQYLKNMGVSASMSISLIHEGRLTGLIACHHYSGPHAVSFAIRETTEYLGQALSWHSHVLRLADRSDRTRRAQEHEAAVMRSVATEPTLLDGLDTPSLVSLVNAQGAAVVLNDGVRTVGSVPSPECLAQVIGFLSKLEGDVFVTNKLSSHIAAAADWEQVAAGLLAVPISRELGEYLLWFRPSSERVIDWAGNPSHEKLTRSDGAPDRLTPRGSFALWREVVRGQAEPWQPWEVDRASSLRQLLLSGVRRRASEVQSLNERLKDADRAKDNFIATVSHELRTPLNAISGWAHLLSGGALSKEQTERALDVISRNVQVQSKLVEDLLDVSRMTSGKLNLELETVNFYELVATSLENAALAASAKGVHLSSTLEREAPSLVGDSARLRQVVENLLSNAIKFTPTGGSVQVSTRKVSSALELRVEDSGRGIAPAFLPHIFEPFRQEDAGINRRSHGLGLGLAIVRTIVELHGGVVSARSEGDGRGAVFIVSLPFVEVSSFRQPEMALRTTLIEPPAELANLRILFVEDDVDASELVSHLLRTCEAQVTPVHDATSALDLLDEDASRFDLILSDIGLPDIDGYAFMRLVRQRTEERGGLLPAVALSAYTRAVDRTHALQAGFHVHIPKPVDSNELIVALASIVRRV